MQVSVLLKVVKASLMLLLFTATTATRAQDSCYVYPYFTVTTTDYKNITIIDKSGGKNLKYMWNFGDGTNSTNPNPGTHVYSSSSTHIISLTLTDSVKNCSGAYTDTIRIPCNAGFSWTSNLHDVNFTANTAMNLPTTVYLWDFGDGTTSTLANPSHHYANAGSYNPCLTVTTSLDKSCSDKRCGYLRISDSSSTDTMACSAAYMYYRKYSYTYAFHATQNGLNYLWNFGDGTTSTLQHPEHTFASAQNYKVCLTVTSKTGTSCLKTYCNIINVTTPKYCDAFFSIESDSSTTDPYDFLIFNQSTGINLNYLWNFGDGTTSTLANPTHDYTGTGPYLICLTISNDSCKDIHCDTLDLSDTLHPLLPGKFHITVINSTTGIDKNESNKATLSNYPNPFNSSTTISYGISTSSRVELEVYNLLGVKIAAIESGTKAPGNYTLEWDAQQLQEGIYLLQLKANDQLITKKIIIHK